MKKLWNELDAAMADDPLTLQHPRVARFIRVLVVMAAIPVFLLRDFRVKAKLWWFKRTVSNDQIADMFCDLGEFDVAAFYRRRAITRGRETRI